MDLNDAQDLAYSVFGEYGLVDDWTLKFDKAKRRFGICRWGKRVISLSAPLTLVNTREQVEDVIRHEVAHALAGIDAGHGPEWVAQCAVTGARAEKYIEVTDLTMPVGRWKLVCERCGYQTERYRRPKRGARWEHVGCGGNMTVEEVN